MGTTVLSKTVKVRFTFDLEKEFPADWDDHLIMFHMNEGSWCADNALDDLKAYSTKLEEQGYCFCASFKGEVTNES